MLTELALCALAWLQRVARVKSRRTSFQGRVANVIPRKGGGLQTKARQPREFAESERHRHRARKMQSKRAQPFPIQTVTTSPPCRPPRAAERRRFSIARRAPHAKDPQSRVDESGTSGETRNTTQNIPRTLICQDVPQRESQRTIHSTRHSQRKPCDFQPK